MAVAECASCRRRFAGVWGFDAHQQWDYSQPPGSQLTCLDPAGIRDKQGRPRFRLDRYLRWSDARRMPPGALGVGNLRPSQGSPVLTPQEK
ncbi:hypothetical protein [Actinocorallia libanotica]|uniref:C2H2-type domain-containing protein n=1 Tax=Actinocorallia libanotica TaxID=46162 RepID=A0ABN1Q0H6_9ACTN